MKTYRRHRCTSMHRTFNKLARCIFPRAAWVRGEGPIALIAWCDVPTVTLWPTVDLALSSADMIASLGCGGRCTRHHEIVKLEIIR